MPDCECRKALERLKGAGDRRVLDGSVVLSAPFLDDVISHLSDPCPCEGMRDIGPKAGGWFYAPCPSCGEIEGMGLSSQRSRTVAVYCPSCRHFGPTIEGLSKESDRSAVVAWNAEYRQAWAERDSLRAELAAAEAEADRWHKAHDGILSEAARMCEEAKRGADEAVTASQERERVLRAELLVRTNVPTFEIEIPEQFRKAGARSAFGSGYEVAWRNQQYRNPYARSDCERAYYAGYRAGEAKSAEAIGRKLCGSAGEAKT